MTLDLLTGPDAGDLLAAAVGTAGGSLGDWWVDEVDHRPGRLTTVAFGARVRWPGGERDEMLGASAGARATPDAPGVIRLSDGEQQVAVWCVPFDPDLPGLRAALDHAALSRLLTSFGVRPDGLTTTLVAYRPRRRAVVRVGVGGGALYVKVVRPGHARPLHERHRLLHDAGVPVPAPLGWSDDGLLVIAGLPGTGLRTVLGGSGPLPGPSGARDLLDRIPDAVLDLPRRAPWAELCDRYADMVATALPAQAGRARDLARAVRSGLEGADRTPVPTHGDFYEAQLLTDPGSGRLTGLLDVDTAGPGSRADDLACAVAHLRYLPLTDPSVTGRCDALARSWAGGVDPAELRLRTAGVLLSLATGPHRVQLPDWRARTVEALDLVERTLSEDESGFTGVF